jgi:hypothetical protein
VYFGSDFGNLNCQIVSWTSSVVQWSLAKSKGQDTCSALPYILVDPIQESRGVMKAISSGCEEPSLVRAVLRRSARPFDQEKH